LKTLIQIYTIMPDSTYTAQGTFDSTRQVSINICIPSELSLGVYETKLYNMSKNTSNGVINVIFCHFQNQSTAALQHSRFDYRMNFDLNKLHPYPKAVAFDESKNDALFIFFHNEELIETDKDLYFAEIENIYDEVKNYGNQSRDGLNYVAKSSNARAPRKTGLSLIIK